MIKLASISLSIIAAFVMAITCFGETNQVNEIAHVWDLTFVWADNPAGTNAVAYPITIRVPFDHDKGFIFIKATKEEVQTITYVVDLSNTNNVPIGTVSSEPPAIPNGE
jgi:hypothetical protein